VVRRTVCENSLILPFPEHPNTVTKFIVPPHTKMSSRASENDDKSRKEDKLTIDYNKLRRMSTTNLDEVMNFSIHEVF